MPKTEMELLGIPHLLFFSAEPQVPKTSFDVEVGPVVVGYACSRVTYSSLWLLISRQPRDRSGAGGRRR